VPNFYNNDTIKVTMQYRTYDESGIEIIRLKNKPSQVLLNNKPMEETSSSEGYTWKPLLKGGVVTIRRNKGRDVIIME